MTSQRIKKTRQLNELYTWAHATVMWYWSADSLFWQLSIGHNMDVHYQVLCLKAQIVYALDT